MSDRESGGGSTHASMPGKATTESERRAIVIWTASLGAVTADALAYRSGITLASARGRLQAAVAAGLLAHARPLRARPALYTVTAAGMKAVGGLGLDRCRVSPGNAQHLIACAEVAAGLERCYPTYALAGERELRREEREHRRRIASAVLGRGRDGEPLLHRPDLVLWPQQSAAADASMAAVHGSGATRGDRAPRPLPIAVEVELTVKAQRRLEAICRAWARCELVAGVLYFAAPAVERPLARAIERTEAHPEVLALPLSCLQGRSTGSRRERCRRIESKAGWIGGAGLDR